MTYELFLTDTPHAKGNGFWTQSLEPFELVESEYKGFQGIGQSGEERFAFAEHYQAHHAIETLNSQLEAYRSKQLSLIIKEKTR
jgi:hypothetical protein